LLRVVYNKFVSFKLIRTPGEPRSDLNVSIQKL
jgi:hypothetical protein